MELDAVLRRLRRSIAQEASANAWCAKRGISAGYVSDVLAGRGDPGARLLSMLGLEFVVTYRTKKPTTDRSEDHGRET